MAIELPTPIAVGEPGRPRRFQHARPRAPDALQRPAKPDAWPPGSRATLSSARRPLPTDMCQRVVATVLPITWSSRSARRRSVHLVDGTTRGAAGPLGSVLAGPRAERKELAALGYGISAGVAGAPDRRPGRASGRRPSSCGRSGRTPAARRPDSLSSAHTVGLSWVHRGDTAGAGAGSFGGVRGLLAAPGRCSAVFHVSYTLAVLGPWSLLFDPRNRPLVEGAPKARGNLAGAFRLLLPGLGLVVVGADVGRRRSRLLSARNAGWAPLFPLLLPGV